MTSLDRAIELAVEAHRGQRDKAGAPYILHSLRVMLAVSFLGREGMVVAVLHDVLEDTLDEVTDDAVYQAAMQLKSEGLSDSQIGSLSLLTHRVHESYEDYIDGVSIDPIATAIKIADLEDNMDITRIKNRRNLTDRDMRRLQRYLNAWTKLTGK